MATRRKAPRKGNPAAAAKLAAALAENKDLVEQQAASAGILRVIAGSPSDVQPVFDTIAKSAQRLFGAHSAAVTRLVDGILHLQAFTATEASGEAAIKKLFPARVSDGPGLGARTARAGKPLFVSDTEVEYSGAMRKMARTRGFRSALAVPMLRKREVIGTIGIARRDPGSFTKRQINLLKTFADQAVIAIENARLFNETKEALERQTATAEILKVISASPTATQPVFESIVQKCHALFEGSRIALWQVSDGQLFPRASTGYVNEPMPIDHESAMGACVLDARTIHLPDLEVAAKKYPRIRQLGLKHGYRSGMYAPLLREGRAIGGISVLRPKAGAFGDKEVELLTTFADQAVIAIENARLFNETKEALEQQTATTEILRVISSSPSDMQPVFDSILEHAMRLCDAGLGTVGLYDGKTYRHRAQRGGGAAYVKRLFDEPFVPHADGTLGRMLAEARPVHIPDYRELPAYLAREPRAVATVELGGARTYLAVPMLKDGRVLGGITIRRSEVRPFTEKQIDLVSTFANQAVIAIENVRLFNETKEALEQQTATAEILKAISSSPTDVQPVFEAIVRRATTLCEAAYANVFRYDGERLHWVTSDGWPPDLLPALQSAYPRKPDRSRVAGRVILDKQGVQVEDTRADASYDKDLAGKLRYRRILGVPLTRSGEVIGVITVGWAEPGPIEQRHEDLLKTFAQQAVIAIENVRLFNETKEALERQTAISEILRVISSSPSDVRPVLDAVAERAARICEARVVDIILAEGGTMRVGATFGELGRPSGEAIVLDRTTVMGRAIVDKAPVHVADLQSAGEEFPRGRELALKYGHRTILGVPLLREDRALGAILVRRPDVRPFADEHIGLLRTFADQAAIAIENVRLFNETKEALERQTATAEILRVISSTPTDTQPVFDAIVNSTQRLIAGKSAVLLLRRDPNFVVAAYAGPEVARLPDEVRVAPLDRDKNFPSRAILDGEIVHVPDWQGDDVIEHERNVGKAFGIKSGLMVPLLREGKGIGAIAVTRGTPGPYHEKEVALLRSFADQAVIAIENVRLFNETREALEQQKASAEILSAISSSIADTRPVFDRIARNCEHLFGGVEVIINLIGTDGLLYIAGHQGAHREHLERSFKGAPVSRESGAGRCILEKRSMQYPDIESGEDVPPVLRANCAVTSVKACMYAPLVWEDQGIGAIFVGRRHKGPFSEKEMALLKTFADQAVIAIQNARLFNETKEALERQTATAEILKVISSSPTEIQPVFDVIVERAVRLCGARFGRVYRYDGSTIQMVASHGLSAIGLGLVQRVFPRPAADDTIVGRVILARQPYFIEDIERDNTMPALSRQMIQALDTRSQVTIPILRAGEPIGAITLGWAMPCGFGDQQVALLQTFADQAVIAIENVRLFKELQERTEALTKSVDQLTALGEVGQAISSTLDPETVLKTIVSRAVQLTGLNGGTIYEFDELRREFHLRAAENMPDELAEVYRRMPIRLGEGIVGGAAAKREPVQVPDIQDPSYQTRYRERLLRQGYRAILAVPLLREDQIIGALTVSRNEPGAFAPEVIDLLKTFATQSAVAIQNARLFREIAEKSRELELASRHKSQFLASMSHELRTPLNAILGFNEMIIGQVYGEVPQDMQEPLEDIQKSGKHLLRLINNVLDLAKIEAGKMELALADYSVHDTVESVRSTLRPLAEAKGLELVASVPEDIPLAYGDGGRLAQCLMNLAGNSLKFTKQGRVEIVVEAKEGRLTWRVSDTGIGIPSDKIATLFSEFRQTDATIASEYGGTGLGLSITKKFVEMHGGRIWVESEWGAGSAFMFEVPLRVTMA